MSGTSRSGFVLAVSANTIWGLFPIFWHLLQGIPAGELVAHRIVWAFLFSVAIGVVRHRFRDRETKRELWKQIRKPSTWATYSLAALLIAINWLAFLWAVTNDRVLLSSLGYYINPLFNVMLGVFVLKERLPVARWIAIGFAAAGVLVMSIAAGEIPWVSLIMASSFAGYALVKKRAKLDALDGLTIETTVMILPSLLFLTILHSGGGGSFGESTAKDLLLITGGFLTLLPLALFSAATQRAPLSLIGILQYVGPTLQFIVGAFYFGEPLDHATLAGFALVWTGVVLFLFSRKH